MQKYNLILDLESTGLLMPSTSDVENQPYIIELAYLLVDNEYNIIKEYTSLIKPPLMVSDKITKLTKITNEMLTDARPFALVWYEVENDFRDCNKIIAHNVYFDFNLLMYNLKRYSMDASFLENKSTFCTANELKEIYGYLPTLEQVYKDTIHKEYKEKHRALSDCKDLLEVLKSL